MAFHWHDFFLFFVTISSCFDYHNVTVFRQTVCLLVSCSLDKFWQFWQKCTKIAVSAFGNGIPQAHLVYPWSWKCDQTIFQFSFPFRGNWFIRDPAMGTQCLCDCVLCVCSVCVYTCGYVHLWYMCACAHICVNGILWTYILMQVSQAC
jgi:hypothetical protein